MVCRVGRENVGTWTRIGGIAETKSTERKFDTKKREEKVEERNKGLMAATTLATSPYSTDWWATREMGNEFDPYNQTPKLDPESDDYKEYMTIAHNIADELLSHAHAESRDGWQGGYVKDGITIHSNHGSDIMSFR